MPGVGRTIVEPSIPVGDQRVETMSSEGRISRWTLVLLLLTAIQVFWLEQKISWVTPDDYTSRCHELYVTPLWRFGFWPGHHGASLVRTDVGATPGSARGEFGGDLEAEMRAELLAAPGRSALELAFYLAVVVVLYMCCQVRLIRRAGAARWMLLPAAAAFLLSLPLLVLGYGCTLYSNYVGPGALSSSGPYISMTFVAAETVSYRALVEAIGLVPLKAERGAHLWRLAPDLGFHWQWILGVVGFYALPGALAAIVFRARRPTSA
jgi:hypothetical protein